ncbi:hypothetical protein [Sulfurimonas sp.]|uniref:hypothetical protein n=1 Tax=Sulfurimonas sp. TaxID=2022749 RepID=UPI003D0F8773
MAIRRTTTIVEEELNDNVDTNSVTTIPGVESSDYSKSLQQNQTDYQFGSKSTSNNEAVETSSNPIGKTNADLLADIIKDPRTVIIILYIIPFIIFLFQPNQQLTMWEYMKNTLIVGTFLNAIWIIYPFIEKVFKGK